MAQPNVLATSSLPSSNIDRHIMSYDFAKALMISTHQLSVGLCSWAIFSKLTIFSSCSFNKSSNLFLMLVIKISFSLFKFFLCTQDSMNNLFQYGRGKGEKVCIYCNKSGHKIKVSFKNMGYNLSLKNHYQSNFHSYWQPRWIFIMKLTESPTSYIPICLQCWKIQIINFSHITIFTFNFGQDSLLSNLTNNSLGISN